MPGRCPKGGFMIKRYDTTFIIDGTLNTDERERLISTFSASLEKLGGNIEQIVRWGLRTLAHEINKRSRGFYVIFYYTADPSIIKSFERELRINEKILRYMTLLFDGENPSYLTDDKQRGESSYPDSDEKAKEKDAAETEEKNVPASDDMDDSDIDSDDVTDVETEKAAEGNEPAAATDKFAEDTETDDTDTVKDEVAAGETEEVAATEDNAEETVETNDEESDKEEKGE